MTIDEIQNRVLDSLSEIIDYSAMPGDKISEEEIKLIIGDLIKDHMPNISYDFNFCRDTYMLTITPRYNATP